MTLVNLNLTPPPVIEIPLFSLARQYTTLVLTTHSPSDNDVLSHPDLMCPYGPSQR